MKLIKGEHNKGHTFVKKKTGAYLYYYKIEAFVLVSPVDINNA